MTANPEQAILSIAGLRKSYGKVTVLKDLQLDVNPGAIHGLVGLNGSGKTTTLECLLGLQSFEQGNVQILGHSPAQLHAAKGKVVAIFDSPSLPPHLTVRQCLQQAALLCERPTRSPETVEKLLGIERFSQFRIRQLSLGNKRRASIAHALLGDPALIILDEPFNGLDAGGVDEVLALIKHLNADQGTTFLLSSHQLPYLEHVCSHIAILHKGQIHSSGAIDTLLQDQRTEVHLRTTQKNSASAIIQRLDGCQLLPAQTADTLTVSLTTLDSASLNRSLVEQGIDVQELQLRRPTLEQLFRQITGGAIA